MFSRAGLRDVSNTANALGRLRLKPKPFTGIPLANHKAPTHQTQQLYQSVPQKPATTASHTSMRSERYDVDLPATGDPLSIYVDDIYAYLREFEVRTHPQADYLSNQAELTNDNRTSVIDWMVDVHARFKSVPESLFTAINYMDRFLSQKAVVRSKLQLIAYTSLFLACKYEDVYTPRLKHWVKLVYPTIQQHELIRAERLLCATLNYDLAVPSAFTFLRRFTKVGGADSIIKYSAHFLCEFALMDVEVLQFYPSLQAASALAAVNELYGRPLWNAALEDYSKYTADDLKDGVVFMKKVMQQILRIPQSSRPKKAIFDKYATAAYNCISTKLLEKIRN
ncbi:hypothetical protein P9112_012429 [Eukaryota sp. TZLM1-RC]